MKSALYIENDVVQIVLTPEDEFEKRLVGLAEAKKLEVKVFDGSFYRCQGGWDRWQTEPTSLIVLLTRRPT